MSTETQDTVEIMRNAIPIIAVSLGGVICIVGIIVTGLRKMVVERSRENSRRDIAAFVAEGSLTPDDAVKLLEAGNKKCWSGPGVVIGASVAGRDKKA